MRLQETSPKNFTLAIFMLVFGACCTLLADAGIRKFFPERIVLKDIMFLIVPYVPWLAFVADGLVAVSVLMTLLVFAKFRGEKIAAFLFGLGVLFSIRAVLNFVTPLGDPSGDHTTYGFLEIKPMLGMFPSGHIGVLSLQYWLTTFWAKGEKIRIFFATCIIFEAFALWATRGHYTIDIVGGVVLGYFAAKIAERYSHPYNARV